ncbi:hypothetical protein G4B88_010693 [Cannabis sativa]|uniref:Uncharacterized protein n=1 Tax=Cannabis sativa TaxID=3483 RepID=A0A7J6EQM6_CANSA|nr:hypothetical protein G4B88_010693 [Cannabis sativa]
MAYTYSRAKSTVLKVTTTTNNLKKEMEEAKKEVELKITQLDEVNKQFLAANKFVEDLKMEIKDIEVDVMHDTISFDFQMFVDLGPLPEINFQCIGDPIEFVDIENNPPNEEDMDEVEEEDIDEVDG